ncbi:MAG: DUF2768 domain-containing protein [Bacillaceae bacterium]
MSPAMIKMYLSFIALGAMFIAVGGILLSRHKIKNKYAKFFLSVFSFVCMVFAGLLGFLVMFTGPSGV